MPRLTPDQAFAVIQDKLNAAGGTLSRDEIRAALTADGKPEYGDHLAALKRAGKLKASIVVNEDGSSTTSFSLPQEG